MTMRDFFSAILLVITVVYFAIYLLCVDYELHNVADDLFRDRNKGGTCNNLE